VIVIHPGCNRSEYIQIPIRSHFLLVTLRPLHPRGTWQYPSENPRGENVPRSTLEKGSVKVLSWEPYFPEKVVMRPCFLFRRKQSNYIFRISEPQIPEKRQGSNRCWQSSGSNCSQLCGCERKQNLSLVSAVGGTPRR
jgi:hypothetical protein